VISKVLLIASLAACAIAAPAAIAQVHTAPPQPDVSQLLQAAEKARDENRDEESIRLFRRALIEQPESEEALWYLGTMLYEKKQYAEARDALRVFMTLRSDAGPGWALLGMCEFNLREYPRALEHLQRAMAQGIGDRKELEQPMLYHLEALLARFDRYEDSLALLAYGELDSSFVEPAGLAGLRLPFLPAEIPPDRRELVDLAGKAVLAAQEEHNEEAESGFKQLVASYPNEPGVHFLYGAFLARQHPDEAVPEFEREIEISPFHVLARVRLAEQLTVKRDFDRALALAQQAIKLEPKRASAHLFAGEALVAKGNAAEGIRELEISRDGDPGVIRTHLDLLRAYTSAGRKEDADREKREIAKLLDHDAPSRPSASGDIPHGQAAP
jgi:tetratricopeptide (TPR) repeat protein